jgi:hypothetical protein
MGLQVSIILTLLWSFLNVCAAQEVRLREPRVNIDGSFTAKLVGSPGFSYTVEVSTNLVDWTPAWCFLQITNDMPFVEPPPADPGRRFYRAQEGISVVSRLSLRFSAYGGAWGQQWVATPVMIDLMEASLVVENGFSYPSPNQVLFTGPPGAGFTNTPASALIDSMYVASGIESGSAASGGEWTVKYEGTNLAFHVPDPRAQFRLVVPFPSLTKQPDGSIRVSWQYRDAKTGAALSGPPFFLTSVAVEIMEFTSGPLLPDRTEYTFSGFGVPPEVTITMIYTDTFWNRYSVEFSQLKP